MAKYYWALWTNFWKQKNVDITHQCFALLPQVNFPANSLNFHWRRRWWDRIQAIFLNIFYFNHKYSSFHTILDQLINATLFQSVLKYLHNICSRLEFENTKGSYNLATNFLIQSDFFFFLTWFLISLIFKLPISKINKINFAAISNWGKPNGEKYCYWIQPFLSTLIIFEEIWLNVVRF